MGCNKVIINGVEKVNLTKDTVSSKVMLEGYTAHDKSGEIVSGLIPSRTKESIHEDEETKKTVIPSGYYAEDIEIESSSGDTSFETKVVYNSEVSS